MPLTTAACREGDEAKVAEQDKDPVIAVAILEFARQERTALALSSAGCAGRSNPRSPPGQVAALTVCSWHWWCHRKKLELDVRVCQWGQGTRVGGQRVNTLLGRG